MHILNHIFNKYAMRARMVYFLIRANCSYVLYISPLEFKTCTSISSDRRYIIAQPPGLKILL